MRKVKLILGVAVIAVALMAGGQIGLAEWTNLEFQDDLHDVSASLGQRIGMVAPQSDEEIRNLVIRKADRRGISLEPSQVTVQRSGSREAPVIYLAVEYDVPVNLPGYSFSLHFSPSSAPK